MAKRTEQPSQPKNVVAQRARRRQKAPKSAGSTKCCGRTSSRSRARSSFNLFVKTLFVEAFRIPSGSMIPTLLVGDWLFVNKAGVRPHDSVHELASARVHEPQPPGRRLFVSPYQADNAP